MPKLPEKKQPKWVKLSKVKSFAKFDSKKHESKNRQFYSSKKWKTLRAWYFKNNPLCKWCEEEGRIVEGKEVDHIKEINDGGEMLSEDNLMTLCSKHHRQKTAWERARRRKEEAMLEKNKNKK